jgi:hypothetical protein
MKHTSYLFYQTLIINKKNAEYPDAFSLEKTRMGLAKEKDWE